MKNSAYRYSKIKHQLNEKKQRGVRQVSWKLNFDEVEFIEKYLHYRVEPYLYEVKTRPIQGVKSSGSKILKDIHYKSLRGNKTIILTLTDKGLKLLDECEIKYRPLKFKIYLNEQP